ncbi:protein IN CHLOROPLAST ATPASE BIOGENESIS, chloroplastic isoform X1 [Neltuma alba]|uniref:protein IN CHLOROPLAST ATPASE BIOGENESIS, chloroplastic isoform X1 n=1 Tax=Neltuma alba TaxID=207710 RepID=UPI0010A50765|nr:protein IN CHLOROPLAST ATPASE BIOGENESIS, chloroplastic-like isoform X1 [Prosopis alba]XP_028764042.1 protein IN CHLOROPLAST ATPASE BIOGENESIS, chloroplastic-like isoform X1 [Prosopis alba]
MRIGGGVVYGGPRANALPLLLSHGRASVRCYSSSSTPDHVAFVKDIAATQPPEHLSQLLNVLKAKGETIVFPGAKQGLIPLAIPLTKSSSGAVTALLRWPTAPPGMEMPVVDVNKHGVKLLAKSVDQYIHRILVEEDAKNSQERNDELFIVSADAGKKLYQKGGFAESKISNLDIYLLKEVGLFPDIIERKVMRHFEEGDQVSALVTGEFYTKKEHFPGFARPFVFNAEVLLRFVVIFSTMYGRSKIDTGLCFHRGRPFCFIDRVGRNVEAKDAARGALKSPWWTLGCKYEDVAKIAQWDDEQIEYIKEKVTEEGRQEDIKKGKAPAQVVLDEAAFLMDLASIEGTWDDYLERIAECYEEAGLNDIARFILHRD